MIHKLLVKKRASSRDDKVDDGVDDGVDGGEGEAIAFILFPLFRMDSLRKGKTFDSALPLRVDSSITAGLFHYGEALPLRDARRVESF